MSTPGGSVTPRGQGHRKGRGRGRRGRGGQGEPSTSAGSTAGTLRARGRGRWHGKGLGRAKNVAGAPVLGVEELTKEDGNVPSTFPFTPRRQPGMYLPQSIDLIPQLFSSFF